MRSFEIVARNNRRSLLVQPSISDLEEVASQAIDFRFGRSSESSSKQEIERTKTKTPTIPDHLKVEQAKVVLSENEDEIF
jgi:hypothetical protein